MNDQQVKEEVEALTGASNVNQPNKSVDWEKKYAELEKKFNSVRIEEGRVKKLDEELKERDKRIAELEAKKANDSLISSLSAEERERIPSEVLDAATKLVVNGMANQRAEYEERFRNLEQRNNQDAEERKAENGRRFLSMVDVRFPGFRNSVGVGGDKADAWASYLKFNKGSINLALSEGDFETFAHHVEAFYTDHLGVQVPSGDMNGSAASDPRNSGGGSNGGTTVSGKTYTQEEFMALYDAVERARDKGDYAEMSRLNAEIKAAPAEGRVK